MCPGRVLEEREDWGCLPETITMRISARSSGGKEDRAVRKTALGATAGGKNMKEQRSALL